MPLDGSKGTVPLLPSARFTGNQNRLAFIYISLSAYASVPIVIFIPSLTGRIWRRSIVKLYGVRLKKSTKIRHGEQSAPSIWEAEPPA